MLRCRTERPSSPRLSQEEVAIPFPPDEPEKIRAKLDAGTLPREASSKMFAGYGDGRPCDGCETPITNTQVEWEFDGPDGQAYRFHLGCAGLWEAERRRRGWLTPPKL